MAAIGLPERAVDADRNLDPDAAYQQRRAVSDAHERDDLAEGIAPAGSSDRDPSRVAHAGRHRAQRCRSWAY
jgi:hypothetical protein